jgi:hypothetical protein
MRQKGRFRKRVTHQKQSLNRKAKTGHVLLSQKKMLVHSVFAERDDGYDKSKKECGFNRGGLHAL